MLLRSQLTHNWPNYIKKVVESFNNTPLKKLGWIAPKAINSKLDTLKVSDAQKQHNIQVFKEPDFKDQLRNQELHNNSRFKVNDYVYLTFNEKLFDKSYDVQVSLKFRLNLAPKNRVESSYVLLIEVDLRKLREKFFSLLFLAFFLVLP
jgi:hypothetical protein